MIDLRTLRDDVDARRRYFSVPQHREDRLWVAGEQPHGLDFGYLERESGIQVVDFFGGRRPRYCDSTHPDGNGALLVLAPTLVLDSSAAGPLLSYIEGNMRDALARAQTEKFLRWFASSPDMNLTPAYNLMERFARSTDPVKAEDMAFRTARAILTVEVMDREWYRASGDLRTASNAADILRSQTGEGDLDTVARKAVADTARLTDEEVAAHYAFLLKVALLGAQRQSPRDLTSNLDELIAFVDQRFFIAGPLEFAVAVMHFARQLPKFININGSMTFEKATSVVEHAAWDMIYARTPTMFLQQALPAWTTLGFVLTADREAAAILRLIRFQMLLVAHPHSRPYLDVDFAAVGNAFSDHALFDEAIARLSAFFARRPPQPKLPNVEALIRELHDELRAYLGTSAGTRRTDGQ